MDGAQVGTFEKMDHVPLELLVDDLDGPRLDLEVADEVLSRLRYKGCKYREGQNGWILLVPEAGCCSCRILLSATC